MDNPEFCFINNWVLGSDCGNIDAVKDSMKLTSGSHDPDSSDDDVIPYRLMPRYRTDLTYFMCHKHGSRIY
jgi:hypothetical protein